MNSVDNTPIPPWYKQPWLWFILAPIIAVVIYGTFFLYLSIVTHDGIVKDDMYKIARGHFVDKSQSQAAQKLGVTGSLDLDNETGDLMLHFKSAQADKPAFLNLSIIHPTHQQYDQTILLKQVPGTSAFTGSLKHTLKGKRYLILEDDTSSWNLRAEIHPPYDQNTIKLEPANQ
jgi:hypothetical protein